MIGGQVIDLANENRQTDMETLKRMDSKKTGALISAACRMGCVIGGASEAQTAAASKYAENIGLAFQIVDDVLDIEGSAEKLGKPIGSDSSNNKSTYVSLLGIDGAKALIKELTDDAIASLSAFGDEHEFLDELALHLAGREN